MGKAKPPTIFVAGYDKKEAVKIATSNLFIDTKLPSEEFMTNSIFEEIAGNELINTQNQNFLVNTEKSNILNLNNIVQQYSPQSLFKSSNNYNNYFDGLEINLLDKIPNVGNGLNGKNIYFNQSDYSIYIEFVNLDIDEEIEIEFISTIIPIGDTIV
jgi:hypothetical protein